MRAMVLMWGGLMLMIGIGCSEAPQSPNVSHESAAGVIDMTQDGTYAAGQWQYVFAITDKGSRSQGRLGTLCYAGQPVPFPEDANDYYDTPLGLFVYMGSPPGTETGPVMPWHDRGWMPVAVDVARPAGRALALPGTPAAMIVQAGQSMSGVVQGLAASGAGPEDLPEDSAPQGPVDIDKDPWGTLYKVYPDMRGGEGGGEVFRWVIQSAGPDQTFGTDDDFERCSAFISTGNSGLDDAGMEMREGSTEMEPVPMDESRSESMD